MINAVKCIINYFGLEEFGVCRFKDIEHNLINCRAKSRLPLNAKSIITMLFPYYIKDNNHNISRYATVPDYHIICGDILNKIANKLKIKFPNFNFVPFIDNSPIPEVKCGVLCGLGCLGDNGLLINKKYGSWVFIGEIVTDMGLEYSNFYSECLHCGRCISKCPGKALSEGKLKKEFCISHISQKKGDLTNNEIILMKKGKSAWGCDICQECCPMNINAKQTGIFLFKEGFMPNIAFDDYNNLEDRAFHWRPRYVLDRNLKIM